MSHYWIAECAGALHLICLGVDGCGLPFERVWDDEVDPAWLTKLLADFRTHTLQLGRSEGTTSA